MPNLLFGLLPGLFLLLPHPPGVQLPQPLGPAPPLVPETDHNRQPASYCDTNHIPCASPRVRLPLEPFPPLALLCQASSGEEEEAIVITMSLLTDLLNLDLSDNTEKIIAEYIW